MAGLYEIWHDPTRPDDTPRAADHHHSPAGYTSPGGGSTDRGGRASCGCLGDFGRLPRVAIVRHCVGREKAKKPRVKSSDGFLDRETALREIAAGYRDRSHYLVCLPPGTLPVFKRQLEGLPCRILLDQGLDTVLATSSADVARAVDVLTRSLRPSGGGVGVVLVPKTVSRALLEKRLNLPSSDDDEDIMCVQLGEQMMFPTLLTDAIDLVDPIDAAQIRAQAVPCA